MVKEKTMEEKRKEAYYKIYPLLDGLSVGAIDVLFSELKTLAVHCSIDSSSNPFS